MVGHSQSSAILNTQHQVSERVSEECPKSSQILAKLASPRSLQEGNKIK